MNHKLTIGWLYPELMSTYGDRGNIFVLTKRCNWRGIDTEILKIDFKTPASEILKCDLLFGGGAQDRQQGIVIEDLRKIKGPLIRELMERDIPGLFVCGSPQLLGYYYMTGDGQKLEGLGLFDMESKHFGKDKPRCIGNTISSINVKCIMYNVQFQDKNTLVGFENHGGRTYLGKNVEPFAKIMIGNGNNGEDGTEGAVYKNFIATYSHGPFLPKNPHVADYLISKALEVKYKKEIPLKELDDALEWKAHDYILNRFNIT
jgi:lipid II isoglutaminyl synthase (glutamine-hydrolysing)